MPSQTVRRTKKFELIEEPKPKKKARKKFELVREETALDFLKAREQIRASETLDLGGLSVNKLVLGLGDGSPETLLRRQYVMEWILRGRIHPEDGKMSPYGIANKFSVPLSVITRDMKMIEDAVDETFQTKESIKAEITKMLHRGLMRTENNFAEASQSMNHIDRAIRFLHDTFGEYLFTHDSTGTPVDEAKVPKHLRSNFSNLKTMKLSSARNFYRSLCKMRIDITDRMVKTNAESIRLLKDMAGRVSGGEDEAVDDDSLNIRGSVGSVNVNKDQRQIHIHGGLTRADLIESARNGEGLLKLPVGLTEEQLAKEGEEAERIELEEKRNVAK